MCKHASLFVQKIVKICKNSHTKYINFTAGAYKVWWWFSGLNWKIRHFTCAVGELALMLQAMATSAFPASLLFHVGTINVPPAAAFTHLWLLLSFSFLPLIISTDYNFSTSCNIVLSILQLSFWIWYWRKRWFLLLIHCTLTFHFRAAVVSRPLDDLCYWYLDFCLSTQITKRQGTAMY